MSMTTEEAGRIGARKRWGPPRRLNVSDLDPLRRERVEAYAEAERRAQEREDAARKDTQAAA